MVTYLGAKTTLKLEVHPSDYVLWVRWKHIFSTTDDIDILDFWEMREGDSVAITSRIEDLPPWFELHPTEVSGAACFWMVTGRVRDLDRPENVVAIIDGGSL